MVNNLWDSWVTEHTPNNLFPNLAEANKGRREEQSETAQNLWLDSEVIHEAPGVVNLRTEQEARNNQRIQDVRQYIANGGGSLGEMAKMGNSVPIFPDSIDEIWPRFEYSKEDAQKYLDALNLKYPIKQVLWDQYEAIVSWGRHLFNMSVVWKTEFENRFTEGVVASARAWKWISSPFHYWYTPLNELSNIADTYKESPFGLIKKHELLWFYTDFLKQWIAAKIFRQPKESQTYSFPKEHLIQDLMRRLWTSLDKNLELAEN